MARALGMLRSVLLAASLLTVSVAAWAQTGAVPPVARPADVATPDAIIDAVYASISGPAAQPRDLGPIPLAADPRRAPDPLVRAGRRARRRPWC